MGNCFTTPTIHYVTTPNTTNAPIPITPIETITGAVTGQLPPPRDANGPTNDICFQHILEAVYDAAIKAQTNVQMNHLHQFFWFFPPNADGTHTARTMRIQVPTVDGEFREIDIPYFNLINQSQLAIHEIKIKTKLDMEMTVVPDVTAVHESLPQRTYYRIELIPGDKSTDLELVMKMEPPCEIMQRILHRFEARV
jgi:hypothetical protein